MSNVSGQGNMDKFVNNESALVLYETEASNGRERATYIYRKYERRAFDLFETG